MKIGEAFSRVFVKTKIELLGLMKFNSGFFSFYYTIMFRLSDSFKHKLIFLVIAA